MKHCLQSWLPEPPDVPLPGIVTSHDRVVPLLHTTAAAGPVLHFDFSSPSSH